MSKNYKKEVESIESDEISKRYELTANDSEVPEILKKKIGLTEVSKGTKIRISLTDSELKLLRLAKNFLIKEV